MSGLGFSQLPSLSSKQITRALARAGWTPADGKKKRKKGSDHQTWLLPDGTKPVTVVLGQREVKRLVLKSIIQGTGLSADQFLRHVK